MSAREPYRRRSARVLLLDGAGRILLLRYRLDAADPGRGHIWLTPGGGVGDGEPLVHAAARELREETGLTVAPDDLGRPVAYAAGHADFGWAAGLFRDDFFCHRVDAHDVDTGRMERLEREHHAGHKWWALDELAATTETVYPVELARLVAGILAGHVPREAVRLPWRP